MPRLQGKTFIVTGGGAGIGKATALKYSSEGANVVIGCRNEEQGRSVVSLIQNNGGKASFIKTDVTKEEDVKQLIDFAISEFGTFHGAFNNAGIMGDTVSIVDDTLQNYQNIFEVNVKGLWLSMKYEIKYLLTKGSGTIVNNSSIVGLIGSPKHALYAASKHAVLGLTKSAALEYGSLGIRINSVCPGAIKTDMLEKLTNGTEEEKQKKQDLMKSRYPIGRLGNPEDVAGAVIWLSSDDSSFVLGENINVDGGFAAT